MIQSLSFWDQAKGSLPLRHLSCHLHDYFLFPIAVSFIPLQVLPEEHALSKSQGPESLSQVLLLGKQTLIMILLISREGQINRLWRKIVTIKPEFIFLN